MFTSARHNDIFIINLRLNNKSYFSVFNSFKSYTFWFRVFKMLSQEKGGKTPKNKVLVFVHVHVSLHVQHAKGVNKIREHFSK